MTEQKVDLSGNYEVLTGFALEGGKSVFRGDVIELTHDEARVMLGHKDVQKTDKKVGKAPKQPHRKDSLARLSDFPQVRQ